MLEFTVVYRGDLAGSWWDELSPELKETLEKGMMEREARKTVPTFSPWLPPIERSSWSLDEISFMSQHKNNH